MNTCIESIDPPADTEIIIYRSVTEDIQQQHSAVDTVDRALAIAVESQLQQYSTIDTAVAHKHSAVETAVAAEVDTVDKAVAGNTAVAAEVDTLDKVVAIKRNSNNNISRYRCR